MSVERRLYAILVEFLKARGRELGDGPLDDLVVPLADGERLIVPVVLLAAGQ